MDDGIVDETEFTDEARAAASLKLQEDVRQLIRNEIRSALEDYAFINATNLNNLGEAIFTRACSQQYMQKLIGNAVGARLTSHY